MNTKQDSSKKILREMADESYNQELNFLKEIKPFAASACVPLPDTTRAVMIDQASKKLEELFDILKLDYKNDENLNDTPFRVASMYVNELMIGRYTLPPRIEAFPADFYTVRDIPLSDSIIEKYKAIDEILEKITTGELGEPIDNSLLIQGMALLQDIDGELEFAGIEKPSIKTVIAKTVDVNSLCSHHLVPFVSTDEKESKCVITYIPTLGSKTALLGISKLQRVADWFGRRPQLQEELNWQIHAFVSLILKSTDVMVSFSNIVHYCEKTRGVESHCGSTSSIVYGGRFEDPNYRTLAYELTKN